MNLILNLARLVLGNLIAYGNQILLFIESEGIAGLETCIPYLKLKEADTAIEKSYKLDRKNKYTEEVKAADKTRDNIYRQLLKIIGSFLFSPVAAEKSAAERLNHLIRLYGQDLPNQPLKEESTNLNGMLTELAKSEYADAIALLKVSEVIEHLRSAQQEFERVYYSRGVKQAETNETPKASKQREAYEEAIRNMITYAEAQGVIGGDPKWAHVCSLIETLNAPFMAQMHTKKANAPETKEENK